MKIKDEKGSMAVYVSVVLLSMLLILSALFLISNVVRRSQIETAIKVKETYEADNDRVEEIYNEITKNTDKADYVQDGLILHYDAINNTGNGHSNTTTTWQDLSGNNNNGTFSTSPTTSTFYWEDDCITLANNSSTSGMYVDTPVNLNNLERTIIYTIDANNLEGSIWGDTSNKNTNGLFNYYNFISNRGDSSIGQARYAYTFSKAGKYNYAVSLSNTEMKFYENGQLITTVNNSAGLGTSGTMRLLSARHNSQNAQNLKMYNFLIYDRVLSDSEIQANYEIVKSEYGL